MEPAIRDLLPPQTTCSLPEICLSQDSVDSDCSTNEAQFHPFLLSERLCPYGLAGNIERRSQADRGPVSRRKLGSTCIDMALAVDSEVAAEKAFDQAEEYLLSVMNDPEAGAWTCARAYTLYTYLPIFKRRRVEFTPSSQTRALAHQIIIDNIEVGFKLFELSAKEGKGMLAERAVEALLARTGDPDLMPYPALQREDALINLDPAAQEELLPCLHDSYVIYEGRKVPIQTKWSKPFATDIRTRAYYNDLVAKVNYRRVCRSAVADSLSWMSQPTETICKVFAQELAREGQGCRPAPHMQQFLDKASETVVRLVVQAAQK